MSPNTDASNIYTADPTIGLNDLVALADPDGLFFPDNIAPVVSDRVSADARAVVTNVSEALTQTELVRLNALSVIDQMSSADIARQWLTINRLNR